MQKRHMFLLIVTSRASKNESIICRQSLHVFGIKLLGLMRKKYKFIYPQLSAAAFNKKVTRIQLEEYTHF